MSSAVVSTPAAQSRPFVFDVDAEPEVGAPSGVHGRDSAEAQQSPIARLQSAVNHKQSKIPPARVTPASQLEIRPAPEMVSSGVAAIDALTGGLPRGCLTEVCGLASSGRTALLLAALAAATRRGEFCAVIDASAALDPQSVAAAGVDLERLLWVRCGGDSPRRHRDTEKNSLKNKIKSQNKNDSEPCLEQVLRAADLLLESGGFGLIALDFGDVPPQAARHIPLTTWFRFRRAIEYTPTILLAIEQRPIAGSCSSLLLQLGSPDRPLQRMDAPFAEPAHARLLTGLNINAELIRSRLDRKPAASVTAFASKTAWAG